ncbi:hypothetical protein DL93DRAFT_1979284 [Clavulina sp. PMI_390]|nr:hypothetical protein DL93DRAFT_1979284 [Clavulina sp. PMI_390]
MVQPLKSMSDLISASEIWDTLVGKALGVLEVEETQPISTPASENLRTALIVAFDEMHTESDSIRQLFSPLTSTLELSMLSEMYAPHAPSISPPPFSPNFHSRVGSTSAFTSSLPETPERAKRSTWNGAARVRHFRGLSELDDEYHQRPRSPPSPSVASFASESPEDTFGSSALAITRHRRKTAALKRGFGLSGSRPGSPLKNSTTSSPRPSSMSQFTHQTSPLPSPSTPASKRDSVQTSPRRGRSINALRTSMDRAVMSRRYAASHLLALRFEEDGSDPYWEDVASVMNLFSKSILETASSLADALNEYLAARMAEQIPTPPSSRIRNLHDLSFSAPLSPSPSPPLRGHRGLPSVELSSFAPMPSDLAQFASHMDIMSTSIETAQRELRICLDALQSAPGTPDGDETAEAQAVDTKDVLTHQVMNAYARLRRELGNALLECERGRRPLNATLGGDGSDQEAPSGSEESTGLLPAAAGVAPISPAMSDLSLPAELETGADDSVAAENEDDDVFDEFINAKRLEELNASRIAAIMGTKNPFAEPAPEQVFEATIPATTTALREKSKISRAERIRQMRERRAAGGASVLSDIPGSSSDERGAEKKAGRGPGGDVVQELRSVINLVSERRRGAGAASSAPVQSLTLGPSPLSRSSETAPPLSPPPSIHLPNATIPVPAIRDVQENDLAPASRVRTKSIPSTPAKPLARTRTISGGAGQKMKSSTRAPPPPPLPTTPASKSTSSSPAVVVSQLSDEVDTDHTFGPHSDSISSPSPPTSPLGLTPGLPADGQDVSTPSTPFKSAMSTPLITPTTPFSPPTSAHTLSQLPPSPNASTSPLPPPRPPVPTRHASISDRVSALLAVAQQQQQQQQQQRPPARPARPSRPPPPPPTSVATL